METGTAEHKILISGGVMILILLSLFGNILVCCAVYYSRNLRARVNYLIVSLAISDILIAAVAMPLWMIFEMTHYMNMSDEAGHRLMTFWMFVDMLGGIASIANLVAISYERLWSVFSPLKHRRYLTNIMLAGIIGLVWGYAIFIAASTIFLFPDWKYRSVYNAVLSFFFPLFLIFTAYAIIFIIVNRSPRSVVSAQDNFKINITICIIIGCFFICWAPHFIFSVLYTHCESCAEHFEDRLWYRSLSMWLHYANSCVNPLVYGIANAQYKEAFKSVFKKVCLCCLFNKETIQSPEPLPIYYPANNKSIDSGKLQVELEPEDKEPLGAVGCNGKQVDVDEMYLPGDYRALPLFPSPGTPRTRRWHSDTSTTTETFLTSSVLESPCFDHAINFDTALLNPESLSRTSYL